MNTEAFHNDLAGAVYRRSSSQAPANSLTTTSACLEDLGVIEHGNGSGLELNPSEYAKLEIVSDHIQ